MIRKQPGQGWDNSAISKPEATTKMEARGGPKFVTPWLSAAAVCSRVFSFNKPAARGCASFSQDLRTVEAKLLGLRSGAAARYGETCEPPALSRCLTFVDSLLWWLGLSREPLHVFSAAVAEAKPRTSCGCVLFRILHGILVTPRRSSACVCVCVQPCVPRVCLFLFRQ